MNIELHNRKITEATFRVEVFGSQHFHQQVGRHLSRPTKLTSQRGDRKSAEYKDQVG
jgi:hypothetical protein